MWNLFCGVPSKSLVPAWELNSHFSAILTFTLTNMNESSPERPTLHNIYPVHTHEHEAWSVTQPPMCCTIYRRFSCRYHIGLHYIIKKILNSKINLSAKLNFYRVHIFPMPQNYFVFLHNMCVFLHIMCVFLHNMCVFLHNICVFLHNICWTEMHVFLLFYLQIICLWLLYTTVLCV